MTNIPLVSNAVADAVRRRRVHFRSSCAGLLAACLLAAGCGDEEELPETAPVSGVVTYKGSPVKDAQVTFHPKEGNPGTGRTGDDGRYVLTTYHAEDGAIPGAHTVTVQLFPEGGLPGQEVASTGADPIPVQYADPSTSPLEVEVKAGEPNDIPLELKEK